MRRCATIVAFLSLATATLPSDSGPYTNGRFGYSIDLPLVFKTAATPENGDGVGLESADGRAKLSVWGNNFTEGGFAQESDLRKKYEIDDGWRLTYDRRGASWASLSGVKSDRIVYIRQIALCNDAMGSFRIEYPAAQQKQYGFVVEKLVKTLKAPKHCE